MSQLWACRHNQFLKGQNQMSKMYKLFSKSGLEDSGIWIQIDMDPDEKPWRFLISALSTHNKKYMKCVRKAMKPYEALRRHNQMPDELQEKVMCSVFCESILLNWENVVDENGELIPFNAESAVILFGKLPYLYDQLMEDSQNMSLFKEEERKEEAKN